MANSTTHPVELQIGSCSVGLRLYRNAEQSGPPAWDGLGPVLCTAQLFDFTLKPGEARDFSTEIAVSAIPISTVPSGHYYVSAATFANGRSAQIPAGEIDLVR